MKNNLLIKQVKHVKLVEIFVGILRVKMEEVVQHYQVVTHVDVHHHMVVLIVI
jgi:hypothetical protein